jgi:hypothetical protein
MLFSGCGVTCALGKRSVPASPSPCQTGAGARGDEVEIRCHRRAEEGLAVAQGIFDPPFEHGVCVAVMAVLRDPIEAQSKAARHDPSLPTQDDVPRRERRSEHYES